jgi:hypothetical protein
MRGWLLVVMLMFMLIFAAHIDNRVNGGEIGRVHVKSDIGFSHVKNPHIFCSHIRIILNDLNVCTLIVKVIAITVGSLVGHHLNDL